MLSNYLSALISYAKRKNLIDNDALDLKQKLCTIYNVSDVDIHSESTMDFYAFMNPLLDIAYHQGLLKSNSILARDVFEARLMDIVMPSPKKVKQIFAQKYQQEPEIATHYLYQLSMDVNYIKTIRLLENISWSYPSEYGDLEITINLAKPEKDPEDIAKSLQIQKIKDDTLPLCAICKENEQNEYNARMNLRIVPIMLGDELWHFQYSPYLYFNEHAIVLHDHHRPMNICAKTFEYLFDFSDMFPTYFIGSNADLPIVGGSILNHDHFQAGKHHFPIESAAILATFKHASVHIEHIKWPLSTIRLTSSFRDELIELSTLYLNAWFNYSNKELDIIASTNGVKHNTITPILRRVNQAYQLDLILRNNRTTDTYPDGIFHPHTDVHHIKKENIGLIEAMGLAILPGRLKQELEMIEIYLKNPKTVPEELIKHQEWLTLLQDQEVDQEVLKKEVGKKFQRVIEDSGVFKLNAQGIKAMHAFIKSVL